jgi:molybdopterin converting factor small subunit
MADECDVHLVPIVSGEGCLYCRRFLGEASAATEMTEGARLEELEQWLLARRSVPAELLYRRIEELAGRRISLAELEDPDLLLQRARGPRRAWDWDDF